MGNYMLFLFSLNSEEQIKIGNETKDYNLSKLPQTTSEGQDIKRLEGDKQLVIELNINKNGISVSGVTILENLIKLIPSVSPY